MSQNGEMFDMMWFFCHSDNMNDCFIVIYTTST